MNASIATIKEDDLLKEEEETVRERAKNTEESDRNPFRVDPSRGQIMLKEEDYEPLSPPLSPPTLLDDSIAESPIKKRSNLEYNDDTIKNKKSLDKIL